MATYPPQWLDRVQRKNGTGGEKEAEAAAVYVYYIVHSRYEGPVAPAFLWKLAQNRILSVKAPLLLLSFPPPPPHNLLRAPSAAIVFLRQ